MSQNHVDYSEKRDFIRMRVDTEVEVIQAGEVIAAVCLDLSASGMQIQAPRTFQVGDELQIKLDSDHPALAGLDVSTRVVWIASHAEGQQKLGLKIISMR
ncbi:PilZ domain-containing protein [Pseudomonas fontis]|uniref:PilZ domain-containing protein n=1 Tax=Pseudomonas fontis TaxID=2942633 RepID=A0ABT5NYS9_9PSED|nr:PilZ domain-containing protein [Pseudomonas fontis]MDD0973972.1 PilZ domain-containing protein [Pseudomonas fontis]MDD0993338.1 PilZ domain-containing protein [Pseudomonas fontis]